MSGALLQKSAFEKFGTDFTNDSPEITYFKNKHKTYENFALETIPVYFDKTDVLDFDKETTHHVKFDNIGHLMHDIFLNIEIPTFGVDKNLKLEWIKDVGIHIVKEVTLKIGGDVVQHFSNDWIYIHYKRFLTPEKYMSLEPLINIPPSPQKFRFTNINSKLTVFLPFYFSKDKSLGIPLCLLKYHDVQLEVKLRPLRECITIIDNHKLSHYYGKRIAPNNLHRDKIMGLRNTNTNFQTNLDVVVSILTEEQIKKIKEKNHRHIVETIDEIIVDDITENSLRVSLNFKRLLKEIWILPQRDDIHFRNGWSQYTNEESKGTDDGSLLLPKSLVHSKFTPETFLKQYWNNFYLKRKTMPSTPIIDWIKIILDDKAFTKEINHIEMTIVTNYQRNLYYNGNDDLYCYSFSLRPFDFQPSGSMNMGMSHNSYISVKLTGQPPKRPEVTDLSKLDLPTPFHPYKNKEFAWKYRIKFIYVHYNFIDYQNGMSDLVIRR